MIILHVVEGEEIVYFLGLEIGSARRIKEKSEQTEVTWAGSFILIVAHPKSEGRGYGSWRTSSRGLEGSMYPSASGGASPGKSY